jgi:hypothetical protein
MRNCTGLSVMSGQQSNDRIRLALGATVRNSRIHRHRGRDMLLGGSIDFHDRGNGALLGKCEARDVRYVSGLDGWEG